MSLCKPKELYPLTFECRSWQHEAERLLYGNLYLHHRRLEQMWSCLMALAAYPHKAALVRSFNVCHRTGLDPMLSKKICAVLPVLPSLVHLGLLLPHRPSFLRSLNSALKFVSWYSIHAMISLTPFYIYLQALHVYSHQSEH